jgi:hypothetical protein
MQCPICDGQIIKTERSGSGGTIAYSLCCGVPLEILDNWDVYEALPEPLQFLAIERAKADHEALRQQWAKDTERFRETEARYKSRWPDERLMKGESHACQG